MKTLRLLLLVICFAHNTNAQAPASPPGDIDSLPMLFAEEIKRTLNPVATIISTEPMISTILQA